MAEILNLQMENAGTPIQEAAAIFEKIKDCRTVRICHTKCIKDKSGTVGNDNTHQDRDNFEHALSPDIKDDDDCKGDQC